MAGELLFCFGALLGGIALSLDTASISPGSAASGVAYTQTYGAIIALNWTEVGRKSMPGILAWFYPLRAFCAERSI